jgi:hypothetical protein
MEARTHLRQQSMYDQSSNELAGMFMVKLKHSKECVLEFAAHTDKPSVDALGLALVVDATCPAV